LIVEFARPIPASAVNTLIAVTVPTFGAGNTVVNLTAHGFQRLINSLQGLAAGSTVGGPPSGPVLCRAGLFVEAIAGLFTGCVYVKV
jgi:hypothetical protein